MAITKVSPLAFREVSENYVPVLIKGERKKNHIISPILIKFLKRHPARKSLVAQWLGLCASIAGGLGLIPGQRIKILPGSACTHAQSLQSCPTFCDPIDCSPPGSSVHADSPCKNTGVGCHSLLQGSSQPRNRTHISSVSCTGRQVLYH